MPFAKSSPCLPAYAQCTGANQRGSMTSLRTSHLYGETGSRDTNSRLYPLWDQARIWDPVRGGYGD